MTTVASLLAVALFGYLIYRYLPKGAERAFRLERYRPRTPMSDWTASYYDDQRRYSDLAAIYGREDAPDLGLPAVREPADAAAPAEPVAPEPARRPVETQFSEYAWRSRRTVGHKADAARKPAKGVRRLVTDPSMLNSKAS
ncbi:hypothetical protein DFR70_104320 [Nocardia tenerifensis]|uniref:Uncharacterized protein n=1 Tax=Nocardia tenerifensis TaxID=228006 RepID=A0A318KQP4_9NOCA|nr:hypothetical protein [Nocardia tenerifensis]PXX65257.1 hypothetical protein DFR70_104320 [Nocardia tenerifensis]